MIEMPEGTFESVKRYYEQNQECYALCAYVANGKPLPKGHGRLIDEKVAYRKFYARCLAKAATEVFAETPTVIEADKESEEKDV